MKRIIVKGNKKDVFAIIERLNEKYKGKTIKEIIEDMEKNFGKEEIVLC